jgi:integrase
MPYQETPGFMRELSAATGASARALELAILTACRTANVIGARWDEFALKNAIWTIPASRMKMGREHVVPLAPSVVALLLSVDKFESSPFVFSGTTSSKHMSIWRCLSAFKEWGGAMLRHTVSELHLGPGLLNAPSFPVKLRNMH